MTKGEAAFEWINEMIAAGKTVYVCTHTRRTAYTARTFANFAKAGAVPFKVVNGELFVARGKSWDCIATRSIMMVTLVTN